MGISDHGFAHPAFGLRSRKLPKMRKLCDEASEQTQIKVLLGVESNIIGTDGSVDLKAKNYDYFDSGDAFWYTADKHSPLTANGEKYDPKKKTAMHKTLPLPSAFAAKYRYFVSAGLIAAFKLSSPGIAIGPGGKPFSLYVLYGDLILVSEIDKTFFLSFNIYCTVAHELRVISFSILL